MRAWKVRHGEPLVLGEVRDLIGTMCQDDSICDASDVHRELIKLGIDIGEVRYAIAYTWPRTLTQLSCVASILCLGRDTKQDSTLRKSAERTRCSIAGCVSLVVGLTTGRRK